MPGPPVRRAALLTWGTGARECSRPAEAGQPQGSIALRALRRDPSTQPAVVLGSQEQGRAHGDVRRCRDDSLNDRTFACPREQNPPAAGWKTPRGVHAARFGMHLRRSLREGGRNGVSQPRGRALRAPRDDSAGIRLCPQRGHTRLDNPSALSTGTQSAFSILIWVGWACSSY